MGLLPGLSLVRASTRHRPSPFLPSIACRYLTSAIRQNAVLTQLGRVGELQQRVAAQNSKTRKQEIIAEYPDLRELLEMIYDPDHRTHLSLGAVQTRLNSPRNRVTAFAPPPSITDLLTMLSKKQVVGHDAKDLVIQFLAEHEILDKDSYQLKENRKAEFELFGRLLDRNLIAGFGAKTLSMVQWADLAGAISKPNIPSTEMDYQTSTAVPVPTSEAPDGYPPTRVPATRRNLKSFPVALGKSIGPPFTEIAKSTCKWYASRKLDGVRVLAFVDFLIPSDGSEPCVWDTKFYSRTGKAFTSLERVKDQLSKLQGYPYLGEILERGAIIQENGEGSVKRLVIDGEVCVMREKAAESLEKRPDEGTGAGAIWSDDNLEEDFTSTVSEIRRMAPYQIAHPVYYIFDILPYSLFDAAKGPSKFGKRVQDIRALGDWLATQSDNGKVLRPLAQWEIKDASEIDEMVARAAEEGWEGLVLRADKPYKGSRSDIRKFKKWQDAEYTVVDVENSRMRLAVNGVFGEYDAMANIWIEHKGVRVSVGSGFTADQRIKFGQNPDLIVGKEVTVEYFSESASSSREGPSLRFPRVKQIWSEGGRTI